MILIIKVTVVEGSLAPHNFYEKRKETKQLADN